MANEEAFGRVAAVCAVVTAGTTLPIHLLTYPAATFEEQVALHENHLYLTGIALVVVHVCLVVVSMLGVAFARRQKAPALITLGFLGYLFFAGGELTRMFLSFFALNRGWRTTYATSSDEATRIAMKTLIAAWPGVNDALFHLFIFGFTAGTAFYAAALLRGRGLERVTGAVFAVWATTNALVFANGIIQGLPEVPEFVAVTLQPFARVLAGVWLWRASASDVARGQPRAEAGGI